MLQVLQTITFTLIATWMSLAAALPAVAASKAERLAPGDGMFRFSGWAGPALDVYYHLPIRLGPTTPIVIVMHGVGRDAERYRNDWSALAEVNGFIVAVPEFDREDFRGSRSYNYGGFRDRSGKMIPRERWTFSAIEPLFDELKRRSGSTVPTYALYGHSAGAQFVHRYVLLMPQSRAHIVISANAGSYAMPKLDVDYPFGLRDAPADAAQLRRALAAPLVVLLGTTDTDPDHAALPRQPEAMAQGEHRLARGMNFFAAARDAAIRMKAPFKWELKYADGIGHSNRRMAIFAAPLLGGTNAAR